MLSHLSIKSVESTNQDNRVCYLEGFTLVGQWAPLEKGQTQKEEELVSFRTGRHNISSPPFRSRGTMGPLTITSYSHFSLSPYFGVHRASPTFYLLIVLSSVICQSYPSSWSLSCSFIAILTWFLMQKASAVLIFNIWRETWGKSGCTLICFYFQLQFSIRTTRAQLGYR